ncbi:MAG: formylglycine-generating enzyme family protein, partial [Anaerolineales bacterium]
VRQAIERAVFQDPRRATSEKTYFLESLKPNPDRLKLTAPFEMELIRIPAGEFRMGSANTDELADDEEKPQQTVFVSEFYMARTPVTVVQFAAFVKATGYKTTAEEKGSGWNWTGSIWKEIKGADWQHPRGPESSVAEKQAHPVTLVSWDDAVAFCRWLNETGVRALPAGWRFRLPTEAEWEKAARGTDGRLWPWGDAEPDDTRCNFGLNVGDTTPVGQYSPKGDSPYGCVDMAGNVCEWCLDGWDEKAYQNRKGIVQDPFNGGNPGTRVLRGGSWRNHHRHCRSAFRLRSDPDSFINQDIGFRVCASRIHLNH